MAIVKLPPTEGEIEFLQTDNNPLIEEICSRLTLGTLFFSGFYCISNHVSESGALKEKKIQENLKLQSINSTEHWQQFCSTLLKITCYIYVGEKEKRNKEKQNQKVFHPKGQWREIPARAARSPVRPWTPLTSTLERSLTFAILVVRYQADKEQYRSTAFSRLQMPPAQKFNTGEENKFYLCSPEKECFLFPLCSVRVQTLSHTPRSREHRLQWVVGYMIKEMFPQHSVAKDSWIQGLWKRKQNQNNYVT